MRKNFVLAIYDDEEKLLAAAFKAREKKYKFYDIYTPFPVHGLDDAMDIKRSILPYVTFVMGLIGLIVAISTQIWMSAIDWPINVGGKPFISLPAFVPISFELTVFFAAHMTVGAFLFMNKLFPGKKPVIFDSAQTCHKFIVVHEKDAVDFDEVSKFYTDNGALEVTENSREMES